MRILPDLELHDSKQQQSKQIIKQFLIFLKDYIDGYEERNQIREKMRQCFEGINVHGLPMLSIPEGESVDYPFLNGRFKAQYIDQTVRP